MMRRSGKYFCNKNNCFCYGNSKRFHFLWSVPRLKSNLLSCFWLFI